MNRTSTTLRSVVVPLVLVVALMTGTLPTPGCGNAKKNLGVAAEAAKDIGGGTRDVIAAVKKAFEQKLITIEQKDKLADLLIAVAKGGEKGVNVIAALEASGVTDMTPDQALQLSKIFTDEVIAPFLDLISEIAKLSPSSQVAIRAALATLRTTILLLSQRIGRLDIEKAIFEREAAYV